MFDPKRQPTSVVERRMTTFCVTAGPDGFRGRVLDWIGPLRKSVREAYLDADFTDLPYQFENPPTAIL